MFLVKGMKESTRFEHRLRGEIVKQLPNDWNIRRKVQIARETVEAGFEEFYLNRSRLLRPLLEWARTSNKDNIRLVKAYDKFFEAFGDHCNLKSNIGLLEDALKKRGLNLDTADEVFKALAEVIDYCRKPKNVPVKKKLKTPETRFDLAAAQVLKDAGLNQSKVAEILAAIHKRAGWGGSKSALEKKLSVTKAVKQQNESPNLRKQALNAMAPKKLPIKF